MIEFALPAKIKGTWIVTVIGNASVPADIDPSNRQQRSSWGITNPVCLGARIDTAGKLDQIPTSSGSEVWAEVRFVPGGDGFFEGSWAVPVLGSGDRSLYLHLLGSPYGEGYSIALYDVTAEQKIPLAARPGTRRAYFS